MEKWYPLYTKPRFEKKADLHLKILGFESFLPTYKTLRQWSDRKKKVELPMFPSYCFVRVHPKNYLEPLKAYGVVKYIWFNGKPIPVEDKIIESIKKVCAGENEIDVTTFNYDRGQKIRIKHGPLLGVEGEYVEQSGKHKLLIWVDVIHQGVLVTINPDNIVAV